MYLVKDGICQDIVNNVHCHFDGGDCCDNSASGNTSSTDGTSNTNGTSSTNSYDCLVCQCLTKASNASESGMR